jgi:hypothetical protein
MMMMMRTEEGAETLQGEKKARAALFSFRKTTQGRFFATPTTAITTTTTATLFLSLSLFLFKRSLSDDK